jgi:hypothetical protein
MIWINDYQFYCLKLTIFSRFYLLKIAKSYLQNDAFAGFIAILLKELVWFEGPKKVKINKSKE